MVGLAGGETRSEVVAADVDVLVLAELNPDVLVSSGNVEVRFGQVEQLIDNATVTLGSSGAITACAVAAQGLRVAVCAVIGDDPIGEWTVDQLRGHGVDVSGVVRRPGRQYRPQRGPDQGRRGPGDPDLQRHHDRAVRRRPAA